MRLTLPYPPSANRYWRVFRGMVVKSKEARAYQASIMGIAREQLGARARFPFFRGTVSVCVVVYRPAQRGDLDNCLKVMLDALKGIAFVDDAQVKRIVADQADSPANPRAEVLVQPRQLAGQQGALELGEAPNDAAPPTIGRCGTLPRPFATPNVVRSSTQHAQED